MFYSVEVNKTLVIDWKKIYTIYHVIDFKALRYIKPNHFILHNVNITMFQQNSGGMALWI